MRGNSWSRTELVCVLLTVLSLPATAQAQECFPAPASLVGWWPGDGDASDIQAGNDGTLVNGPNFVPAVVGQGFDFDGVNQYMQLDNSIDLNISGDFTSEFWFRINGQEYNVLMSKGLGLAPSAWWVRQLGPTTGKLQASVTDLEGDGVLLGSPSAIVSGVFHHFAIVRSSNTVRLYLDGEEIATASHVAQALGDISNAYPILVAADSRLRNVNSLGNDFANVTIDELAMYDQALTPAQVQAIFDAGSSGKCKDEDGDGFRPPDDCDESDPSIHPDANELIFNFVDENCDGNLGACNPCAAWRNHGEYVRCVSDTVGDCSFHNFTQEQANAFVTSAAHSDIGKPGFVPEECQP